MSISGKFILKATRLDFMTINLNLEHYIFSQTTLNFIHFQPKLCIFKTLTVLVSVSLLVISVLQIFSFEMKGGNPCGFIQQCINYLKDECQKNMFIWIFKSFN